MRTKKTLMSVDLPVPVLLTDCDLLIATQVLHCDMATLKAVIDVESGKTGFLLSRRPKILFEAHHFSRLTQHRYDRSHPTISSRAWNQTLYKGGEREYNRLQQAIALNRDAALQSASWGRFQILGEHYLACGFATVDSFVRAMYESEVRHLAAFIRFITTLGMDAALREHRWAVFARQYNGVKFAELGYDTKLKVAYTKYQTQEQKA